MATCKECSHVEVCKAIVTIINEATELQIDDDTETTIDADLTCEYFADRSRFVELPCKVGDTVYFILRSFDGKMRINPEKVCYFTIDANELRIHTTAGYFTERDMNGGVFFTRERAEQVLKERES